MKRIFNLISKALPTMPLGIAEPLVAAFCAAEANDSHMGTLVHELNQTMTKVLLDSYLGLDVSCALIDNLAEAAAEADRLAHAYAKRRAALKRERTQRALFTLESRARLA